MQCVVVAVSGVLAVASATAVNYCGARVCGDTNAHTFCQYPEGPSPQCVGYIKAHLTKEEKARVVARLNRRRNEAAGGHLRGFPSAGNMLKLRWVEELAREAQRWADQCRPPRVPEEHDLCRDLYSIPVGQCVASVVGEAPGLRIESMVDMWYMQNILYKGNVTYYKPPVQNQSSYGDFGQIIWSRSYMVGCGRSRFMAPWNGRMRSVERLVCNLAPHGPTPARSLWIPAAPATNCPPRAVPDDRFVALCNFHQNVEDISFTDTSMTLEEHILLSTVLEIENNHTLNYFGSLDEIYLTQLAIATIGDIETTQGYFNSIQRRDIAEIFDLDDVNNSTNKVLIDTDTGQAQNNSIKLESTTDRATLIANALVTKKKVNLIGRPKSYNIEDLTDFEREENHRTPNDDLTKRIKDFYSEYDLFENEDNMTASLEPTNVTAVTELLILSENVNGILNADLIKDHCNTSYNELNDPVNSSMHIFVNTSDTTEYATVHLTQYSSNGSTSQSDKAAEDYLSDPETVRQLQDALDRMEHTLESQQIADRQGKVRREIRKISSTINNQDSSVNENLHREETARNKSLTRGPMMNMVLKYMPYLKEYEGEILGHSSDNVGRLSAYLPLAVLSFVIV